MTPNWQKGKEKTMKINACLVAALLLVALAGQGHAHEE